MFRDIALAAVIAFALAGCEQPVLEPANCLAARDRVKQLYSLHMDGGANPQDSKLEKIKSFVSAGLFKKMLNAEADERDLLTVSEVFPKAFRVGECREVETGVEYDVILFWRTADISKEQKIVVGATNENGWVVSGVRIKE